MQLFMSSYWTDSCLDTVQYLRSRFVTQYCSSSYLSLRFHFTAPDRKLCSCFQVYAWGCGACLGCGSSEATALRPKLIEELATTRVVDISIGDSHCLALSHGTTFLLLCACCLELKYILKLSLSQFFADTEGFCVCWGLLQAAWCNSRSAELVNLG